MSALARKRLVHPVMENITVIRGSCCGSARHDGAIVSPFRLHHTCAPHALLKLEYRAMAMHGHGIYNKKVVVWSRNQLRRCMGLRVPDYGYEVVRTTRQQIVGFAIALAFWVGRTRPVRAAVQRLPLGWTGRVFQAVRKRWRSATQTRHKARPGDFPVRWRNEGGDDQ